MGHTRQGSPRRGGRGRRALTLTALGTCIAVVTAAAACGDGGDGGGDEPAGPVDADRRAELLGPEDRAGGEPVRIGMVSDGAAAAFDTTDELRVAEATAEYWNTHRGGIAGRPIELVTCETAGDPARGTDCGNRMVEEGAVAVMFSNSAVAESAWDPLHDAGVPTMFFQATGERLETDAESTFLLVNPLPTLFGLPISLAERAGADKVAFVVIDVPLAVSAFEANGPRILDNAGLDYEVVRIPPGTPDMTPQMQEVVDGGAGVVHVLGNDTFCIAAFQGLATAGYEGELAAVSQCMTDATREVIPGDQLEGISVLSSVSIGADDDPSYQLYRAVTDTYGDEIRDPDKFETMGAYTVTAALAGSLEGMSGDVTPATVTRAIKAMDEQELPGAGGATFRCGGSAVASLPAVCTNQWLRATLDAEGHPDGYEVEDSSAILEGL
jgi:branched-chain amino acid transport system substrate-binding protein